MRPSLKNLVPVLQTYLQGYQGIRKLFTAIYGDVDSLFQLALRNLEEQLVQKD